MRRKVHKDLKTKKVDLKNIFSGISQKAPLGNVVRELHGKFHWGSSIRKLSKIGGNISWKKNKKETRHP